MCAHSIFGFAWNVKYTDVLERDPFLIVERAVICLYTSSERLLVLMIIVASKKFYKNFKKFQLKK